MSETLAKNVKGYKVFNPDWTCRNKQYTCPGNFKENVSLDVCNSGMHFCERAADCFNYYGFNPKNKIAEVVAYGNVIREGDKCCTDKLKIIREISWQELLEIINTGKGCTGLDNSGNYNSGNYNSGNFNSGNYNSGNFNSGNYNSGYYNSGNYNSGYYNSGYCNSGDYNSGNYNSGNCNSGNYNSGNFNSGNYNSGYYNSGYCNSGDYNSGNYNSGNYNSGYYNQGNFSNGCFNTEPSKIYMFNKPSEWTLNDWIRSGARKLLHKIFSKQFRYVSFEDMTDDEKASNPKAENTGGYLKRIDIDVNDEWRRLTYDERETIMSMPNFDKEIFKEITGIDVDIDSGKHNDE